MNMMKAILDIENKAQDIEGSVKTLSGQMRKETDTKISKLLDEARIKAEEETQKFKEEIEKTHKEQLKNVQAEIEDSLSSLERVYSENRDKWILNITEKIIKGEEK